MITISNLKKAFGQTIACDIPSFEINDGDILGLVGNNGAGKTTLFRMLLDLLKPDEGEVALDSINPSLSEEWKSKTGAYIDEGFLIDFLTPEEYFAFLGKIANLPQEEVENRLKDFERLAGGEIFGQKKLIRKTSRQVTSRRSASSLPSSSVRNWSFSTSPSTSLTPRRRTS